VRIAVGSDHAGFHLKQAVTKALADRGVEVIDLGADSPDISVDWPDFGEAVGRAVSSGRADLGVAVCGSGIGVAIAANKVPGVRAANAYDVTSARLAREHNHANVLCLGERLIGTVTAIDALVAWLGATPGDGRHAARIDKLSVLDEERREGRRD
jgi:ribose 5-phosphate isomerase B